MPREREGGREGGREEWRADSSRKEGRYGGREVGRKRKRKSAANSHTMQASGFVCDSWPCNDDLSNLVERLD